jgi:acetolactate synthase-1/2/3 large subunit
VAVFALGDARLALAAVVSALTAAPPPAAATGPWRSRVAALRDEWRERRDGERASAASPVSPPRVMGELQRLLRPADLVVSDASLASGWAGSYLEQGQTGRRFLFPRGLAGLGWALPAAIGAALARPDDRVVAVMGDGALGYTVGELATVVQHRLDVVLVVLNNSSFGWIRWYRRITFERGWEHDDLPGTDYAAVAAAYGLVTERVTQPGDLAGALERVLGKPGPGLVEVVTSVWDTPVHAHRRALDTGRGGGYGS